MYPCWQEMQYSHRNAGSLFFNISAQVASYWYHKVFILFVYNEKSIIDMKLVTH